MSIILLSLRLGIFIIIIFHRTALHVLAVLARLRDVVKSQRAYIIQFIIITSIIYIFIFIIIISYLFVLHLTVASLRGCVQIVLFEHILILARCAITVKRRCESVASIYNYHYHLYYTHPLYTSTIHIHYTHPLFKPFFYDIDK